GRELRAGIDVAVIGIEPVRLAVGRDRNEGELFWLHRIRHVVERDAGSGFLAGRRLDRTITQIIVVAEDEDLPLLVDSQISATVTGVAGNEAQWLDVLRIAHVRDQDAEQRRRRAVATEIGDAVVDAHGVEAGADFATGPALPFRPRRA